MDFADEIKALAGIVEKKLSYIQTEEAAKNALVMPFIRALGYNVFDPAEVVPEFTADVGTKKGEKVDYALMKEGVPIILFECKSPDTDLDVCHASQLYRYFSVTPARIAVLTNGVVYRFYSDLEEANKMDSRPFLEFNLFQVNESLLAELKKLSKPSFDLDRIITTAGELKYTRGIKKLLQQELAEPSEGFVRLLASEVYSGRFTSAVREQFTGVVKKAFREFVNEQINERLQSALEGGETLPTEVIEEQTSEEQPIVTTSEELEAFNIVRAILAETIAPERVTYRDRKTYCAIFLDDNSRKPICRLWFNTSQKYIGLFDAEKNETRVAIERLTDIFRHRKELHATVGDYEASA